MIISKFATKFSQNAGILSLMKDLGEAQAKAGKDGQGDLCMMGGGNPGFIPSCHQKMMQRLQTIAADEAVSRQLLGSYSDPQGDLAFRESIAGFLAKNQGWSIDAENICLTNGSQTGFFLLFNMFAGECDEGVHKKIRLPLAPEYIGYADIGLTDNFFVANRPLIEDLGDHFFKYRVDFDAISIGDETGALCVSRPTNPTGNVITDDEVHKLDALARKAGVPLILDGAYGLPFPGMIFTDATPFWNENTILCLSLSKLGLPGTRTGIVVAKKEIIQVLAGMNAIMALAPSGLGAFLTRELFESGEIAQIGSESIRPFYEEKMQAAVSSLNKELSDLPFRIHKPEGAMFLWLWFEGLPISSLELYERLKRRGVLVISGHYFFPGLEHDSWQHKGECLRLTYSQDQAMVQWGIEILAEEVRAAYGAAH